MHQLIIILVVVFVGFRVARRVQRNFTWNELRTRSAVIRIGLFAAVGILLMTQSGWTLISIVSDAAGILIGVALGFVSLTMTVFERRGAQLFWKANAWIAGSVTALFIIRLGYRIYELISGGDWSHPSGMGGSDWLAGLTLIMFAYYVTFYFLLLSKTSALRSIPPTDRLPIKFPE